MNWKDLLHYGAAGAAIVAGALTELGVSIPGIVVSDPKLAITAGVGILVAGLKGGWVTTK
jgi:hypothetical protein